MTKTVRSARAQRGMVTVEMALASLGLAVAVVVGAGGFSLVLAQLGCSHAASAIARQAAREDLAAIDEIVAALPATAVVTSHRDGDRLVVEVAMTARPWGGFLPAVRVHAQAMVITEQGGG